MIDILQTDAGDIAIAADGTQQWTTTEQQATAQRLRAKYQIFLGEWFLDSREGVPYYEHILGIRPVNENAARAVLRKVAADDPAVENVTQFDVEFDHAARSLTVTSLVVQLTTGDVVTIPSFVV